MTHTMRSRRITNDSSRSLHALVDEWRADEIISPEQAQRMLTGHLPTERWSDHDRPQPSSVVTEAAGYLGGALVVVATLLIGARYWGDLTTPTQLATTGAAAAGLLVAGALVSGRGRAGSRLASVLWLASTAGVSALLALAVETAPTWEPHAVLVVAGTTAAYATALWAWHRVVVQQIAMMVALMMTATVAIADETTSDSLPGLGAWGAAGVWLLLGWGGWLAPRRAVLALAAAAMMLAAVTTLPTAWGFALAFVTVALLVALAVRLRELLLLAVAAIGALQVLPAAAVEWFPDSMLAPFTLLAVGVLMVGAAVWTALRKGPSGAKRQRVQRRRPSKPEEER